MLAIFCNRRTKGGGLQHPVLGAARDPHTKHTVCTTRRTRRTTHTHTHNNNDAHTTQRIHTIATQAAGHTPTNSHTAHCGDVRDRWLMVDDNHKDNNKETGSTSSTQRCDMRHSWKRPNIGPMQF